jgi:glycosyltransferase involved in cell wall biosynthesis
VRICVCGAQSLFMTGGAELHHVNLVEALEGAGHEVELVRLPVAWARDDLLESTFAWRLLKLRADLVIATNFPSYFVRHPRKIVWLFHQHRAAYDSLDQPWSDLGLDDRSLAVHRELVGWDTRALSEADHLFATSSRVADRLRRFNGLTADVLYHPPPLSQQLSEGEPSDYLFCATRLEGNKRPELMISAMAHVQSNLRLVVAGRGSLRRQLEAQVRELGLRDRVTLLGFVPDGEVLELYAHARAVIYVPFDEDYGYVPLQAFYAAKPVITTEDSGGVLEWVKDGVTGAVALPTPLAVATAIERVTQDLHWSQALGRAGRMAVASLSWPNVVAELVHG